MTSTYPSYEAFDALLSKRHSCRSFHPDPVPRDRIEMILRLAQKTASWNNVQPWKVHITTGKGTERFRKVMLAAAAIKMNTSDFPWPQDYVGIYQERRRSCGLGLYAAVGIAKGDREASARQALENFRLFGAPHVAVITSDALLDVYGAIDCGAYVANFMAAAETVGVATIAQGSLASRSAVIRDHFQLPADRKVVCGIAFGFEDVKHPANAFRTDRADLSEVVVWEGD